MSTKVSNEQQKSRAQLRRSRLIELSNAARSIRSEQDLDCPLNDIIIENFYKDDEHQEFKTLRAWNEEGFRIIKGSRAFVIWGRARKITVEDRDSREAAEKKMKYFPMAYLFSNAQVEEGK